MLQCTLIIHAPANGKTPFHTIFATGVGPGYIIYKNDKTKLTIPGSTVVLLANDQELRAEGVLAALKPAAKTGTGKQRYDVHVEKWTVVPYKWERVNRCGVAVICSNC